MSDTIFADDQSAPVEAPADKPADTTVADPYVELLKGITNGEGGVKYATVSDALTAIPHKESHIAKLEGENAEYRQQLEQLKDDLNKASSVDTLLEKLDNRTDVGDPAPTGITEQDVLRVLQDKEKQEQRNANAASVVSKLRETFGEKAEEVFYGKAEELGVNKDFLDEIAKSSPAAALELFKNVQGDVIRMSGSSSDSLDKPPADKPRNVHGLNTSKEMLEVWRSHAPQ